jgi:hypothetical protein
VPVGDFAVEIGSAISYFACRITGRQYQPTKRSFGQAFGVDGYAKVEGESRSTVYVAQFASQTSYDDDIGLAPYKAGSRLPKGVDGYSSEESTVTLAA